MPRLGKATRSLVDSNHIIHIRSQFLSSIQPILSTHQSFPLLHYKIQTHSNICLRRVLIPAQQKQCGEIGSLNNSPSWVVFCTIHQHNSSTTLWTRLTLHNVIWTWTLRWTGHGELHSKDTIWAEHFVCWGSSACDFYTSVINLAAVEDVDCSICLRSSAHWSSYTYWFQVVKYVQRIFSKDTRATCCERRACSRNLIPAAEVVVEREASIGFGVGALSERCYLGASLWDERGWSTRPRENQRQLCLIRGRYSTRLR